MDFADFDEAWNTFCHQTMGLPPNVGQDVDFCELVIPPHEDVPILAESDDDDNAESISSDEDPFVFFGNSLPSGFYHVKPDQPLPPNDDGGFVFDELFGMCATPVPVAAASPRRGGKKNARLPPPDRSGKLCPFESSCSHACCQKNCIENVPKQMQVHIDELRDQLHGKAWGKSQRGQKLYNIIQSMVCFPLLTAGVYCSPVLQLRPSIRIIPYSCLHF